jgi:hypothetical protein
MAHLDISRACWRCTHWAGFADGGANHSRCSRLNACPVQASPATGCAYWLAGPGDALPPDWMPVGFKPWNGPRIYGKPPAPPRPASTQPERPSQPCDHFAFDQKPVAAPWRLTGELLNRARHP